MNKYFKSLAFVMVDSVLLVGSFCLSLKISRSVVEWSLFVWAINVTLIVGIQLGVFLYFGLYRAVLRYAGIDFFITILKAITYSSITVVFILYLTNSHVPLSVIFLDWLFSATFVGGFRFIVRYHIEFKQRYQKGKRVLVYGAGEMGSLALRQLMANKSVTYSPVGFIDDDASKKGLVMRGVRVLGSPDELDSLIQCHRVEEVVVAIAELSGEKLKSVVKNCRNNKIACRIIPCFSRLLEIEPDMRNVELADLMRRTPRDLDAISIKNFMENKTVLVTGAAGSIGSELVRQCLKYSPGRILALDQHEYGLYSLQEELKNNNLTYVLCDATNKKSLNLALKNFNIDIIFHAAAYKHVPLLESNPFEAVRNNVVSTKNLCELADDLGIGSFVMISTDKAVKPSSVMGATKRICELVVQNFDAKSKTTFISVRFGNVLGSSGSVVPKFIEQIRRGGPVTVTHPDVTRYFMLIEEAAQLVLQAATIGKGREIFILDMGEPVRIVDMAEDLIYLMGREPHKEINIEYTGLRPGEKVHEELFNDEVEKPTQFKEITIARPKVIDREWLEQKLDILIGDVAYSDSEKVLDIMAEIVPDGGFCKNDIFVSIREGCCELQ